MSGNDHTGLVLPLKLAPAAALVGAGVLLIAGLGIGFYDDAVYRSQKAREVRVQAQIMAASVAAAVDFNDPKAAQESVNALMVNPDVEAAAVYGSGGRKLAGFSRPDAPTPTMRSQLQEPQFEGSHLFVVVPVLENGAAIGSVYLRSTTESPQRRIVHYGGAMLLLIMAALVLAIVGVSQRALARANRLLEARAAELAATNRRLETEMEERGRAEEELRQSQKMEAIGQLSGGIAHDFNNLLTISMGNLQLLQRRLAQGQRDVQRYIDSAMEGLKRAASLTQRILAFSRRQALSPQPVNLSQLIENMGELVRHSAGERVQIKTDLKASWPTLCDPNQMENVVLNLAINARDAMPDGGTLTIETADIEVTIPLHGLEGIVPGDYVRLSIRDTGVGMTEEVRRRAVDPFFTTKPQGQGTGLGLSMTFGYVRQSNGYLKIDSAPGRGTTINILMPRHMAEAIAVSA
jgi:signal transduction histidine kinase